MTRTERLTDPDEERHFHYPLDEVMALLAANPAAGPEGPDDDRVRVSDFIDETIAEATAAYTAAQAAYIADPGDATKAEYDTTKRRLQEARAAHRANRGSAPTVVGVRAPRVGE